MFPHEVIRYCETKKNWRKTVMCIKVVEIPNSLKLRSCSQESFAYCETKNFDWRTWFSVLMHRKFRYPNFSGLLKGLPTQFVSTVRPKNQWKNAIPPFWALKVSTSQRYLKTEGFPNELYRHFTWKKIKGEKWYQPLRHEFFSIAELFWYTEVFHNEILRHSEMENFRRKTVTSCSAA